MTMHSQPAYVCDYCGSHTLHLGAAKRHEKTCFFNPVHRACRSCGWWFKNRPEYGTRFREGNKQSFLPFCSHPDEDYSEEVYTPGYYDEGGYTYNVPRKDCAGWRAIQQEDRNEHERLKAEAQEQYRRAWEDEHEPLLDRRHDRNRLDLLSGIGGSDYFFADEVKP